MKRTIAAIGLVLALAACKQQPATVAANENANAAVANEDDANVAAANDTASDTAATDGATAGSEAAMPAASTAPVTVIQVPAPAATVPAAEAAPLRDAAALAVAINGQGYERVRSGDGWAWRHDGQIVRTASADGHRVAYYRPGESAPYLVQDDGRAYEYRGGQMSRAFDDRGHPITPDAAQRREADQAAHDARSRHDAAPPPGRGADAASHAGDRASPGDHGAATGSDRDHHAAPPPSDQPGPQGNRVTEHKGQQDHSQDRSRGDDTSRARDDHGDRRNSSDDPHS